MKLTALYYHGKRIEALYFGNKPIVIFGYINISMKDTIGVADDSFVRGTVISKKNVDHSSKSRVLFADIMNSNVTFISELIFSGQNKIGLNEDVSAATVILIPFDNSERITSVQSDVNCRVVLIVQFGKSDNFAEVSSDICAIPINILKFEINESGPIISDDIKCTVVYIRSFDISESGPIISDNIKCAVVYIRSFGISESGPHIGESFIGGHLKIVSFFIDGKGAEIKGTVVATPIDIINIKSVETVLTTEQNIISATVDIVNLSSDGKIEINAHGDITGFPTDIMEFGLSDDAGIDSFETVICGTPEVLSMPSFASDAEIGFGESILPVKCDPYPVLFSETVRIGSEYSIAPSIKTNKPFSSSYSVCINTEEQIGAEVFTHNWSYPEYDQESGILTIYQARAIEQAGELSIS